MRKHTKEQQRQKVSRQHFFDKIVYMPQWRESMKGENENRVMGILENLGYKEFKDFERQYPIGERFVIDFAFVKEQVAIEVDGSSHLGKQQRHSDKKRDAFLKNNRWVSIRIQDKDMFGYKGSFYKSLIKQVVDERHAQWNIGILSHIDVPKYVDEDYENL